jgi:O-antigen/teichoic acid export membrane protein
MKKKPPPADHADDAALSSATRRGTPLVLLGHLASQLMGVGTLAVLYRLLEPEHYGILGTVLPAVMLPRMAATLGPGIAVLQRKELSAVQLSVLFWLQTIAGIIATAITVAICAFLSWQYKQPLLLPIGAALSGGTLFASLGNQHQALLERDLRFGTGSLLRLVAQFVACSAAIAWAFWRPDVWSLVIQHVAELGVLCLGAWLLTSWRPFWPQQSWHIGEVLHFSAAYSASSLLHFVSQNIEKVVLPILFGLAGNRALGLYSQAFGLMIKPVYLLTTPLTGVMVSSLAKAPIGSELYERLTARFFRLSALGLFPCAIGLSVVSDELMLLLGGDEWRDSGPLLRWLAPSLAAIGLMNLSIFVLASRGMGRALWLASIWQLLLVLQAAAVGIYAGRNFLGGDEEPAYRASVGLAAAFTLVQVLVWCGPFLWFTFRSVGVSPGRILSGLWPSLRAALLMGLIVFGLKLVVADYVAHPLTRLLSLVVAGVISFAACSWSEIAWLRKEWLHREATS